MTRDEVCQEFGAWYQGEIPEEVHWYAAEAMADEIVRLRSRLTAVEEESDMVMAACRGTQMDAAGIRAVEELTNRTVKAERILATLREVYAAANALYRASVVNRISVDDVQEKTARLFTAVAAAEREVANDAE